MVDQISEIRRTEEWMLMSLRILTAKKTRTLNKHHRNMLDAIMTRRADLAASAMRKHIDVARLLLIRSDQYWELVS